MELAHSCLYNLLEGLVLFAHNLDRLVGFKIRKGMRKGDMMEKYVMYISERFSNEVPTINVFNI